MLVALAAEVVPLVPSNWMLVGARPWVQDTFGDEVPVPSVPWKAV